MNENKIIQNISSKIKSAIRLPLRNFLLFIFLAFLAGALFTGLFISGQRFAIAGKLDQRYDSQYGRAAEIIGQLETELERERNVNRQLREHNQRAGELAAGASDAAQRNVRNLQETLSLISEIRAKLKVLAEFYADSNPGNSGN